MRTIARVALETGMVLSNDVLNNRNEIIIPAFTKVDENVITRLERHSIMVVSIMEEIDNATTHFEKIRLSEDFKQFEQTYLELFPQYKDMMNDLVENGTSADTDVLMQIYYKLTDPVSSNKKLLDYLYNMVPEPDELTHIHCLNSALIAGVFADWLGMHPHEKDTLIMCAFFYDIGKLKLPYELLWNPEKLTDLEYAQIKTHPLLGFDIVENQANLDPSVKKSILMHHERCDGTGYPSKLKMHQIDFYARHISIIDAYEAMTSPRVYRQTLTPLQVIENFEKSGFLQYDYEILRPIMMRIADTQIGLMVKLSDESIWEIFLVNQQNFSKPVLKRNITGSDQVEFLDLMKATNLKIVSIY